MRILFLDLLIKTGQNHEQLPPPINRAPLFLVSTLPISGMIDDELVRIYAYFVP